MQYSKPMIELVYEIRRRVPTQLKPSIKLANPELFDELLDHYQGNADTIVKALIKELLLLAGEPWSKSLKSNGDYVTKSYRGTIMLEQHKPESSHQAQASPRMYRGQVVS